MSPRDRHVKIDTGIGKETKQKKKKTLQTDPLFVRIWVMIKIVFPIRKMDFKA